MTTNNNYLVHCSDIVKNKNYSLVYKYYFETIEQAQKAKRAIEAGGNKAIIKAVKGGRKNDNRI